MGEKVCRGCGISCPLSDYYQHGYMADGRLNYCKECVKSRMRKQRRDDPRVLERERARGRQFDESKMVKYRTPAVRRAHSAVARAVRAGRLSRPSVCTECGSEGRVEAAHEDYSRPLDIRWLCRRCHCRWDHLAPKTAGLEANAVLR